MKLKSVIELHDSSVEAISHGDGWVHIELWCVLHMSTGRPGLDDGLTAVQEVMLSFEDGRIDGSIGNLPSDILDGEFRVGMALYPNIIGLPCDISGEAVSLTLFLHPDYRRLLVSGKRLKVTLQGEPSDIAEWP